MEEPPDSSGPDPRTPQSFKKKKLNQLHLQNLTAGFWSRSALFCFTSPVVHKLGHEFEDRRGAGRVVVPELDGPLEDWHVGWISTEKVKEVLNTSGVNVVRCYTVKCSAVRIHPVEQHHEARLGVEGERDASKVSDQTHQRPLQAMEGGDD